jgi:hypothetical protein
LIIKALNASRPARRRSEVRPRGDRCVAAKNVFFPKRLQWKIRIYFASSTLASIPWEGFR